MSDLIKEQIQEDIITFAATCSAFEEWWQEHGLRADPPVLEMAYKEIAFKGWVAAAAKCATVCEFWGDKSRSIIITNFLPNSEH